MSKKGSISIEKGKLIYKNDKNYFKHAYFKTTSFEIDIDNIAIIGTYHTVIIDDEEDFIVFIEKNKKKHFINLVEDLNTESFLKLNSYFNLDLNLSKYSYDEYMRVTTEVLYPKKLKTKPMYKRIDFLFCFFFIILKAFKIKKIADGFLTKEVDNYIERL